MYIRLTEQIENGDNVRYYQANDPETMIIFVHSRYRGKNYSYSELTKPMAEVVKKLGYKFERIS